MCSFCLMYTLALLATGVHSLVVSTICRELNYQRLRYILYVQYHPSLRHFTKLELVSFEGFTLLQPLYVQSYFKRLEW
jgi:hypothetical protein